MIKGLLGIEFNVEKARIDGKVQNLASYINAETLKESHKEMDEKKAKGIDGIAKAEYATNLEGNIEQLVKRMKNGSYRPQPSRRTYIPKDGSKKMRPLARQLIAYSPTGLVFSASVQPPLYIGTLG